MLSLFNRPARWCLRRCAEPYPLRSYLRSVNDPVALGKLRVNSGWTDPADRRDYSGVFRAELTAGQVKFRRGSLCSPGDEAAVCARLREECHHIMDALALVFFIGVVAVLFAVYLAWDVLRRDSGSLEMQQVSRLDSPRGYGFPAATVHDDCVARTRDLG